MDQDLPNLRPDVEAQLADIKKLPTLPGIARRAIVLAQNPEVDFHKLAEEISKDTAVTASVIRMSNSAYFRPSRRILSVHEAIVTLGLKTVKDIIVIAATEGIINVPLESYRLEGGALWEHSLLVAEIASTISRAKKTTAPADVAFTAGILHDIGKV
ncbi:MAG: HDOD domain-containing protein, partial [Spirochaetia bacterium]|nr:HDOD domain-containing protein [Spirochaetia bacterium]